MCEARRAEYVRLLDEEGMNFTQAAHCVLSSWGLRFVQCFSAV